MIKLSLTSQAILDALGAQGITALELVVRGIAASAIRELADHGENLYDLHEGKVAVVRVEQLLAIATELENAQ